MGSTSLIDCEVNARGNVPGCIDFRFIAGKRSDIYFGLEAKKLNRPSLHNAAAYVGSEGMGRFISGKYAPKQKHGGMIGYVMDGDCGKAVSNVRQQIDKHRKALKMLPRENLRGSSMLKAVRHVYGTEHHIRGRVLTLHHVMLAA